MPASRANGFANRLRATRELQKLNQTELAELSGLTPAAVSQLESGDRLPAFNTIVKIADVLKTSVGYLLGEEASAMPPELRAVFRDLQELDERDVDKVRDYAAFLRAQSAAKQEK